MKPNTDWILKLVEVKRKLEAKKGMGKKAHIDLGYFLSSLASIQFGGEKPEDFVIRMIDEIASQVTEDDLKHFVKSTNGALTLEEMKTLLGK